MKKSILCIATVAALAAIGCSKSKDATTTTTSTTGSVTLRGVTYNEVAGADTTNNDFFGHTVNTFVSLNRTSDNSKIVGVFLYSFNPSSLVAGTHNIGGTFNLNATNQIQILVEDSSALGEGLYAADSITSVNVTIALSSSGKATATIPSIKLKGLFTPAGAASTSYNDSVTFSGTVIQN